MPVASVGSGIELEYETFGSASDPAVILISGFTAQLLSWDVEFCEMIASSGRYVVRFDNRDCGLSTKFEGVEVDVEAVVAAAMAGQPLPAVPYTLSDMAGDVIGLLDALGIAQAHIVGASMGGMIVQTAAIEHPERLLSATSIMSTIGDREYGQADDSALAVLLGPPPNDRAEAMQLGRNMAVWSSRRYFDPDERADLIGVAWDRAPYTQGGPRQLAAIFASGDRTEGLRGVTTPMLVIHGTDDTLIDISGGRRTAELVPGASLFEVADMGHDLPRPLWPMLTSTIVEFQTVAANLQRSEVN